MALTVLQLKNAPPRERDYKLSDERGLYVLVRKNGSKLFQFKYRFAGKEKKLSFGPFPEISLQLARKKRDDARRLIDCGIDPSEERRSKKLRAKAASENTFGKVAREFIEKRKRDGLSDTTVAKAEWLLSKIEHDLGRRPIEQLSAPELLSCLRKIEGAGQRETARRLRSFVSRVIDYAVITGRAPHNPAKSLGGALAVPQTRHFPAITDRAKLGELLRAIATYEAYPSTMLALKLAPHLFVRPGELRHMKWMEVDFQAKKWTIPGERTKMRRPHEVPLSTQVCGLLRSAHSHGAPADFVLPAFHSRRVPISENTINQALRRLGYAGVATAHGFRSTASSLLNESGRWNPDAIERALAHKDPNQIRATYNRSTYWEERVKMMQWWSDELDLIRSASTSANAGSR